MHNKEERSAKFCFLCFAQLRPVLTIELAIHVRLNTHRNKLFANSAFRQQSIVYLPYRAKLMLFSTSGTLGAMYVLHALSAIALVLMTLGLHWLLLSRSICPSYRQGVAYFAECRICMMQPVVDLSKVD